MLKILILLFFVFPLSAAELQVVPTLDDFENTPEFQAIMTKLKSYGEFSTKSTEEVKAASTPATKPMSRGQQMVEEAKARNRALLAQNKASTEKKSDLTGIEQWKEEVKRTQDGWKREVLEQRKAWQREQKIFLGRLKVYKENTFTIPVKEEKIEEKKIVTSNLPSVHIVHGAFQVPIRDQVDRPTCSAFAGVRALEILLAQNKIEQDLSEQYFYWASKPNCQSSPCAEKGSWIPLGLKHSQTQSQVDIPLENNCTYAASSVEGNETQVPLLFTCRQGVVKVASFEEVRSIADMVEKIKAHTPVIMAAKLTENFYRNEGLVTLSESESTGQKLNSHSKGHAMLAVGIIELPEKLKATEGHFCLVVANSWSKGWGAGGYSCLTENWLNKYRQPAPFFAVTKINTK